VWVTPGAFRMGTDQLCLDRLVALHPPKWVLNELPSEKPDHSVFISKGFWIDRTEVTNAAYDAFIKAGGYEDPAWWSIEGWKWRKAQAKLPNDCLPLVADHPRVCVTWYEAQAYAAWRGGRLPSEAEWEYAARGPDSRIYPWGDAFDSTRCNVVGSGGPVGVGSYPLGKSWVGAEDMAGNAMEWVHDWLDVRYYDQEFTDDPRGPEKGSVKVEKGGWWGSNRFVARSAYRHFEDPPEYQDHHIGFRIVSDE
jgi:formylglycine-generating enzyme required for sulfatase activity